jgi:polyisoprenoid-binding protein YceI
MFKKLTFMTLIFSLSSFLYAAGKISVKVKLSPAGSFNMEFKDVKGELKNINGVIQAKKLSAKVKTLKTGMDLRDKHSKEKLEYKKFPYITVTNIKAKKGIGVGTIKIKGISKKIKFKYKKAGSNMMMTKFPLSLKDFKFQSINYMGVGVTDKVMVTAKIPIN